MRSTAYLLICLLFALLILSTVPCSGSIGGQKTLPKISKDHSRADLNLERGWCGTYQAALDREEDREKQELISTLRAIIAVAIALIMLRFLIPRAIRGRRRGDSSKLTPDDLSENPPTRRTE